MVAAIIVYRMSLILQTPNSIEHIALTSLAKPMEMDVFFDSLHYTLQYITDALARAHIAPTLTIAAPCGPALPLLPPRRKVQSLAGLSAPYLSSACVVCLGDGALVVPSGTKRRDKRLWCIRVTCPSHVRRLCRKMLMSGSWLVLSEITLFGTWSCQETPRIRLRHVKRC